MTEKTKELRRHRQCLQKFGPKKAGHPSIGEECPACHRNFDEGDFTTLISLGPGNWMDERRKARQGRPYSAVAVLVHYACATGWEE
jgi:hypothetical protein